MALRRALCAVLPAVALSQTQVSVYEGPTECEDAARVSEGSHVRMHYTGTIDKSSKTGEPGKQFDSSRTRGETLDFTVGSGMVITGWDKGLVGLCTGSKATLVIPPEEGYGEEGAGDDIPGGATLNFDVEVVQIMDELPNGDGPPEDLFAKLDADGDKKLSKDEVLAYFKQQGEEAIPEGLWEQEDKDADGFISWHEFGGPKGEEEL
eukprot:TRINITY_DN64175_c0_g1_i1.p1 TRINITY_DN64175_c0_g1~~TRINITY_DN64175_c0_g1_i1.p1  ORF type:complete len:207 (+),score=57.43 TRINITY_DN64175_c0_g1_i1:47-667(+)